MRSFSQFASSNAVSEYMSTPGSELEDKAKRDIFEHFMRVTGPSMSLYERHPFDASEQQVADSIPGSGTNIWSCEFNLGELLLDLWFANLLKTPFQFLPFSIPPCFMPYWPPLVYNWQSYKELQTQLRSNTIMSRFDVSARTCARLRSESIRQLSLPPYFWAITKSGMATITNGVTISMVQEFFFLRCS